MQLSRDANLVVVTVIGEVNDDGLTVDSHKMLRRCRSPWGTLRSARPTVVGKPRVGRQLKVRIGRWTPGTKVTVRWFANGKRIKGTQVKGVQGKRLRLTRSLRGKRITVRVIGTKKGYVKKVKRSLPTRRVQRR